MPHQESPQPNVVSAGSTAGLSPRFWGLVLGTGIGAGLAAGLLMTLLRAVQHLAWTYHAGTFLEAVQQAGPGRRIAVLLGAGAIAGFVASLLRQPPGGHAGELAEAIWFRSGRLPRFRTTARAVLSIVIVGMGASLGREAAPKQMGAVIASLLADWARLSLAERRLLAACGAGAGIAAVYNVPLGGALFALEVLLGTLALPLVAPALTASLLATAVSWSLLPDRPTYSVPHDEITATLAVGAIVAGPLAGLAAALYVRAIAWADALKPRGWRLLVVPVLVFSVLGCLALPFPQLLGNGKDVVEQAFLGGLGMSLLAALLVLKPVATAACLGSGAPGGLFTPTLAYGALLGGLLGQVAAALGPEALPGATAGSFAMIGAGAVLAAATQGPISAIVLLLELTHRLDRLMVPLMLAVAGAVAVARLLEARSIYSGRIHRGKAAAETLPWQGRTRFGRLISDAYEVVSSAARYSEVLQVLMRMADHPLPLLVVDEHGRLVGRIPPALARDPPAPLAEIALAADIAVPVPWLSSSLDEDEVVERLQAAPGTLLPVVDTATGRLIGIAAMT